MKRVLWTLALGAACVVGTSCTDLSGSFNKPLDGDYNPLDPPGSQRKRQPDPGPLYTPGTWVEVSTSSAALYTDYPEGNEQPDQTLAMGTPLKVVGSKGSYVKVETESGLVGWVPAIMVGERGSPTEIPIVPTTPQDGDVPPVIDPIDPIDPVPIEPGLGDPGPGSTDPGFVAPEPEVPPLEVEEAPAPEGIPEPVDPVAPPPAE